MKVTVDIDTYAGRVREGWDGGQRNRRRCVDEKVRICDTCAQRRRSQGCNEMHFESLETIVYGGI